MHCCIYVFTGCSGENASLQAAALEAAGVKTHVLREHDPSQLLAALDSFSPQGLLFTDISYPAHILGTAAVVRQVEEHFPDLPLLLAGPAPTAQAEYLLTHTGADIAIHGDADSILPVVFFALDNPQVLHSIPGLTCRAEKDTFIHTPPRAYQKNLDTIHYDFSTTDVNAFMQEDCLRNPFVPARGCIHNCSFCGWTLDKKAPWRGFSAQRVLELIDIFYQKKAFSSITFEESDFFTLKDRSIDILHGLKKRSISPFSLYAHASSLDADRIRAAHDAGIRYFFLGLESFSSNTLECINKKLKTTMYADAIDMIAHHAPESMVASTIIIAFPFQTLDDIVDDALQAFALHERYSFAGISFGCLVPTWGTRMMAEINASGYTPPLQELAQINYANAWEYAKNWCPAARTEAGEKLIWYLTHPGNFTLRTSRYGFLDSILKKIQFRLARFRIRKQFFFGMYLEYEILCFGENLINFFHNDTLKKYFRWIYRKPLVLSDITTKNRAE